MATRPPSSIAQFVRRVAPLLFAIALAMPLHAAEDARASAARGVAWLRLNQTADGYWAAADHEKRTHDIGVTGLALLALIAAQSDPADPAITRGTDYLLSVQDPDTGCFGGVNSHQAFLYDHAVATLALIEAYAATSSARLADPAQRGIDFIQRARNPYKAWRYSFPPDGQNDMSVTGWMVLALAAARDAGLKVDDAAFDGARMFCDEMTDPKTWRTGYLSRGGYSARNVGANERWPETATEAMTAVALLARLEMGEAADSAAIQGASGRLMARLPLWDETAGTIDYYYWYFGTRSLDRLGGQNAARWSEALTAALVPHQRGADQLGSFDPQFDPWGIASGRAGATAMLTLALLDATAAGGTPATDAADAAQARPLIAVLAPGEPMRVAMRAAGVRIHAFDIEVEGPDGSARHAHLDAAALPRIQRGGSLVLTVTADGIDVHDNEVIGPKLQSPVHIGFDEGQPLAIETIGAWQLRVRRDADVSVAQCAVGMLRSADLAVRTADELEAAARAAVAVINQDDVPTPARRMITGDADRRVVSVGTTHGVLRVELDRSGIPLRIRRVSDVDADDAWSILWPASALGLWERPDAPQTDRF